MFFWLFYEIYHLRFSTGPGECVCWMKRRLVSIGWKTWIRKPLFLFSWMRSVFRSCRGQVFASKGLVSASFSSRTVSTIARSVSHNLLLRKLYQIISKAFLSSDQPFSVPHCRASDFFRYLSSSSILGRQAGGTCCFPPTPGRTH